MKKNKSCLAGDKVYMADNALHMINNRVYRDLLVPSERRDYFAEHRVENGDKHYLQMQQVPIDKLGKTQESA